MADHTTNFKDFKQSASQSDKLAAFFVFLVWPLLGLILSFKHYKFKNSVNVIWLFSIFVGMTFGFPEGTDSTRYAANLIQLHSKTNYSFNSISSQGVIIGLGHLHASHPLLAADAQAIHRSPV
jgi:hypothetical protein